MKKSNPNLCEIKGCYNESYISYYGHTICLSHFNKHCDHSFLKKVFNIPKQEVRSELKEMRNLTQTTIQ
jgi:hypothetical protein